jgi:hypothetical protein
MALSSRQREQVGRSPAYQTEKRIVFTCSQPLLMACQIALNHTPKDKEPTIPAKRSISLGIDPVQRDFISS